MRKRGFLLLIVLALVFPPVMHLFSAILGLLTAIGERIKDLVTKKKS